MSTYIGAEVIPDKEKSAELEYPVVLQSHTDKDVIVLFKTTTEGVFLSHSNRNLIGIFATNIVSALDGTYWKKFNGRIILKINQP